jgi:sec-independent protein translocase protein TatA
MNLGAPELLLVLLVLLVLFGGAQLPKLARSLGEAKKELTSAMNDDTPKKPTDTDTKA